MRKSLISFSQFILVIALLTINCGCQKSKKPVIKSGSEEVTQETFSTALFGYKTSFAVNTSPHELADYFLKDMSWIQQLMGAFQFKITDPKAAMDLSQVGNSFDAAGKILGINLPLKIVNIRYVTDKELCLLLLSGEAWMLVRMEAKPSSAGTMVSINSLGYISPVLSKLADNLQLQKIIASRIDFAAATVQAKFDPSIDPKQLVAKGLRGESFEKFFQVYQASVWMNAAPDQVIKRGLAPENFRDVLATSQVKGAAECLYDPENRRRWDRDVGEGKAAALIYCPDASMKVMGISMDTPAFIVLKPKDLSNLMVTQVIAAGSFSQMDLFGKPENGGTRVWIRMMVEPPGAAGNLADMFIAISGIPEWIKGVLMGIKSKTEAVG